MKKHTPTLCLMMRGISRQYHDLHPVLSSSCSTCSLSLVLHFIDFPSSSYRLEHVPGQPFFFIALHITTELICLLACCCGHSREPVPSLHIASSRSQLVIPVSFRLIDFGRIENALARPSCPKMRWLARESYLSTRLYGNLSRGIT